MSNQSDPLPWRTWLQQLWANEHTSQSTTEDRANSARNTDPRPRSCSSTTSTCSNDGGDNNSSKEYHSEKGRIERSELHTSSRPSQLRDKAECQQYHYQPYDEVYLGSLNDNDDDIIQNKNGSQRYHNEKADAIPDAHLTPTSLHLVADHSRAQPNPHSRQHHQPPQQPNHLLRELEYSNGDSVDSDNEGSNRPLLLPLHHQGSNAKDIRCLLRVVNILVISLIILFCIAVLNLLSGTHWPKHSDSRSTATVVEMDWHMQVSSPGSTPTVASSRSATSSRASSSDRSLSSNSESSLSTLTNNKQSTYLGHNQQTHQGNDGRRYNSCSVSKSQNAPKPPARAKRIPRPLTLYNETLIDNYRWMHQINQDPDVESYIKAEVEYTKAWVKQSGIKALQKQLEHEMAQIRDAMARQPLISDFSPSLLAEFSDGHDSNERPERLEATQFWELDEWRYWLDDSIGDHGVYKRRPIPRDAYRQAMEDKKQTYLSLFNFDYSYSSQYAFSVPSGYDTHTTGGCSGNRASASDVQVVLDVNRLAKKRARKGDVGQLIIGSIEVQPKDTSLDRDPVPGEGDVKPTNEDIYVAYTYDTSGDERYHIQIKTLSSKTSLSDLKSEQDQEVPLAEYDNPHTQGFISLSGAIVKDAGAFTRWVKLGRSLYLYFTRLDLKGLSREVWRIKIDSVDDEQEQGPTREGELLNGGEEAIGKKHKKRPWERYQPELVMQEKNEGNVLTISQTNDQRFLLIESAGQTNSYTYFLSIDSPEKGWNLIRRAEEDIIYKVEHHSGYFYLRTNHGGATNFKVLRIPVEYYLQDPKAAALTNTDGLSFLGTSSDDDVVIAHDPAEFMDRFDVFVEHFVAWIWRGGVQEIRIYWAPRPGDGPSKFPLSEAQRIRPYHKDNRVATVMPGGVRDDEQRLFMEFYSTKLRYSNSSFIHPWALYEFEMHSVDLSPVHGGEDPDERVRNATRLICQEPFPLGIKYGQSIHEQRYHDLQSSGDSLVSYLEADKDPKKKQDQEIAKFKEIRIMVPSRHGSKRNKTTAQNGNNDDGEQGTQILIPVTITYYAFPNGRQFPRKAAFVKAYGAYGTMTSPTFDPEVILPLLHRGLLYVQIHPRGDGILGPEWYADGKAEHKLNTFYDVEDVLLYMKDSGMVEKEGIVMEGRSAGGLVSGWIANRWGEPTTPPPGGKIGERDPKIGSKNIVREMVKVVLAQVPFMDVIADMSDPDIPWVEYEWSEWGSPLQNREIFEVMKAYSPYDRIRNQPYPPMMILGGLTDGRVSFAEPLKYVAKLRSIDGKTNDCRPFYGEEKDAGDTDGDEDLWDDTEVEDSDYKECNKDEEKRMCASKKETPLLLQMEDGGHFSGSSSLWMAFALYHLDAEKVVTTLETIDTPMIKSD
ncbi:hypothetical protein EDD21DRAFT_361327 [Dissophora ornata]|nr:hypothetical protein BGZ58_000893 [Dissophora ornata]KAI8606286.1 hypothetical protein EDD21DRAFT_361327 [Dissophora ornata]